MRAQAWSARYTRRAITGASYAGTPRRAASYTGTSLTVSMWSTPYLDSVVQSNQTAAPFGPGCTRVVTERTRTYLDGHSIVDKVFAVYQPAEGVKCR